MLAQVKTAFGPLAGRFKGFLSEDIGIATISGGIYATVSEGLAQGLASAVKATGWKGFLVKLPVRILMGAVGYGIGKALIKSPPAAIGMTLGALIPTISDFMEAAFGVTPNKISEKVASKLGFLSKFRPKVSSFKPATSETSTSSGWTPP
ncbi:hypothetical protein J7M00_03800 [bacterium]|nr:hypothetical protein [bacterium]